MRTVSPATFVALALGACGQGSIEVVLRLPVDEASRPKEAAQISLRADRTSGDPVTLTAPIRDGAFALGELPVDDYTGMTVELRSASGGTVGYGRAALPVEVDPEGRLIYEIPVRRPRAYLAGPTPEETIEAPEVLTRPRLLRIDRGTAEIMTDVWPLAPGLTGAIVASAGPDLFLAVDAQLFRLDSSTDTFGADPIATLPAGITDLTGSPDGQFLVAAAGTDLVIVDLATGAVRATAAGGPVGAVTLGREPDGTWSAVALVDAARTAAQCPKSSRLVLTPLGAAEAGSRSIDLGGGVADVAGTTTRPFVVAADLCGNRATVIELGPDARTVVSAVAPSPCVPSKNVVCAPTAVAAVADQAWIGGTVPAVEALQPQAPPGTPFPYTSVGAHHQLVTVDLVGAPAIARIAELPEIQQALETVDGAGFVINRNMKARGAVVSALSVSADGSIVTMSSNSMGKAVGVILSTTFEDVPIVPAIALHMSHQLAVSTQTGALEASLRTKCTSCENELYNEAGFDLGRRCFVIAADYLYPAWNCARHAGGEPATDFEGGSSSALFGRP